MHLYLLDEIEEFRIRRVPSDFAPNWAPELLAQTEDEAYRKARTLIETQLAGLRATIRHFESVKLAIRERHLDVEEVP